MKHAEKLPSRGGASSSPPPAHRLSHAIAKTTTPPRKIRITHVLAPEIIKTEARHFRDLVQRLTGKPPQKGSCASSSSASTTGGDAPPSPSPSPPASVSSCDTAGDESLGTAGAGFAAGIEAMKVVKEEPESSSPSPSGGEGGGFLRALELDGFYQGLEDFLFSPCDMDGAVAGFNF